MRAAAHPFSLSSSFTCPILACNQPLGIPIRYSQSPSFQPTCVTTNACGEASRVSLKSLVVFLFMLLLPRLISSSRQGGISHWHRWSESVWYPTQPMWTHLSAETHNEQTLKRKMASHNCLLSSLRSNASGYHGYSTKNSLKIKSADMVQTGLCVTQCLANRNGQ